MDKEIWLDREGWWTVGEKSHWSVNDSTIPCPDCATFNEVRWIKPGKPVIYVCPNPNCERNHYTRRETIRAARPNW